MHYMKGANEVEKDFLCYDIERKKNLGHSLTIIIM